MSERERSISEFNRDVEALDGYVYTRSDKLSCRLSNARMSDAIHALVEPRGKRIADVGCGDGTYSLELAQAGAREVVGFDAAEAAVESARRRAANTSHLRFEIADVYALPRPDTPYDVAVVRGLLHHLYDAPRAIASIAGLAREVVVLEPNGYSPILKLIEKVSPYHREHEEKSYPPRRLDRWFEACGGRVEQRLFIGLVPMFCPDWMARGLKRLEPLVEATPGLRAIGCGQYVQRIRL